MKITDLLKKQSICLDGKADSKEQVIREMVDLMAEGGNINDIDTYRETVFKREEEGTTGEGNYEESQAETRNSGLPAAVWGFIGVCVGRL